MGQCSMPEELGKRNLKPLLSMVHSAPRMVNSERISGRFMNFWNSDVGSQILQEAVGRQLQGNWKEPFWFWTNILSLTSEMTPWKEPWLKEFACRGIHSPEDCWKYSVCVQLVKFHSLNEPWNYCCVKDASTQRAHVILLAWESRVEKPIKT